MIKCLISGPLKPKPKLILIEFQGLTLSTLSLVKIKHQIVWMEASNTQTDKTMERTTRANILAPRNSWLLALPLCPYYHDLSLINIECTNRVHICIWPCQNTASQWLYALIHLEEKEMNWDPNHAAKSWTLNYRYRWHMQWSPAINKGDALIKLYLSSVQIQWELNICNARHELLERGHVNVACAHFFVQITTTGCSQKRYFY